MRIVQPRLRHRLQVDRVGPPAQRPPPRRPTASGPPFQFSTQGSALVCLLGAIYAAGTLGTAARHDAFAAIRKGLRWRGPLDDRPRRPSDRPRRGGGLGAELARPDRLVARGARLRPHRRAPHEVAGPEPLPRVPAPRPPRPRRRRGRRGASGSPSWPRPAASCWAHDAPPRGRHAAAPEAAPAGAAGLVLFPGAGSSSDHHTLRGAGGGAGAAAGPPGRLPLPQGGAAGSRPGAGAGGDRRRGGPAVRRAPRRGRPTGWCSAGGRWAVACARWRWPTACPPPAWC